MFFSSTVLLKTKLRLPRLPGDVIPRPRLIAELNASPGAFLTLVVAPAGAGKSTAVSQWLAERSSPVAWLSLDRGDNDLPLFLQYFLAAIQTALPYACRDLEPLLAAPSLPSQEILVNSIVNGLAELPTSLVLVLDDAHVLREPSILELLNGLIEQRPAPLSLVITSRGEMPLRLARLRAQGQVAELDLDDLRFTTAEIQSFSQSAIEVPLTDEAVAALEGQTEGWAAGLRLSLLSLARAKNQVEIGTRLHSARRATVDYLVDEVLAQQTPAMQRFLLRISFLDRFTAPLCDAVMEGYDTEDAPPAEVLLREVEQANLFLTPLDATGQWYRFHHLFREMLFDRLQASVGEADLRRLRRRASVWCAGHDLPKEALLYALAASDDIAAARIVEDHVTALMNAEDHLRLERWLSWLPAELTERRPALLIAQVWVNRLRIRDATNDALLNQAQQLLDADTGEGPVATSVLRGQIQALRAEIAYWSGRVDEAIEHAEQALAVLPADQFFSRGLAEVTLLYSLATLGQHDEVDRRLARANYRDRLDAQTSRVASAEIIIGITRATWPRVENTARWLLDASQRRSFPLGITWSCLGLVIASLEQNHFDAALQHVSIGAALLQSAHVRAALSTFLALALIRQVLGQRDKADEALAEAESVAASGGTAVLLTEVRSMRARLCLMRGDPAAALPMTLSSLDSSTMAASLLWFESPFVTRVRVYLAQGTREYRVRAEALLAELLDAARATHAVRREIEVLVLSAVAHEQGGRRDAAVDCLAQAVQLAEVRGAVYVFVEAGPTLTPLLECVRARGIAPAFVAHLLTQMPATAGPGSDGSSASDEQSGALHLVEPLTNRELDVLEAIAHRRANKEIAADLSITERTAKKHVTNILGKLGAANRTQAITRAREVGLL